MKSKKTLVVVLIVVGAGLALLACCPCGGLLTAPIVNRAIVAVRVAATEATIKNLGAGLEAFKMDWGAYPPSSAKFQGARKHGSENLTYYLMGPEGNGWGLPANGATPFGGQAQQVFGPYYRINSKNPAVPESDITDAFKPAKPILYFRFNRDRDPPYDVRDNPTDQNGFKCFASQEHFEMLVRPKDPEGNRKWVQEDYLLISPGADRWYGHVVEDAVTHQLRPARPEEIESGAAMCDDITNFRH